MLRILVVIALMVLGPHKALGQPPPGGVELSYFEDVAEQENETDVLYAASVSASAALLHSASTGTGAASDVHEAAIMSTAEYYRMHGYPSATGSYTGSYAHSSEAVSSCSETEEDADLDGCDLEGMKFYYECYFRAVRELRERGRERHGMEREFDQMALNAVRKGSGSV